MSDTDNTELAALRKRILLPWQVQRGAHVWAPWGKSGWSALEIKKALRKRAEGMRVKPHNGTEVAKGKVRKDRLIKRDPKLKGKDRPSLTPDEVFAQLDEMEEAERARKAEAKVAPAPVSAPRPEPREKEPVDEEFLKRTWEKAFGPGSWDEAVTDDW